MSVIVGLIGNDGENMDIEKQLFLLILNKGVSA